MGKQKQRLAKARAANMSMATIMLISTLTAGLLIAMAPTAAAENPSAASVFGGAAFVSTPTTRNFALRTTNADGSGTHLTWEVATGGSINVYYRTWTSGLTPPGAPTACNLDVRSDSSGTVIRTLDTSCPTTGTSYTVWCTSNGLSGGTPWAGTMRLRLTASTTGIGAYSVDTDLDEKGAIRCGMDVSAIARNAYPSGSTFAYHASPTEAITVTATHTATTTAQQRGVTVRTLDGSNNVIESSAVTSAVGGTAAATFTVSDTYPAASTSFGANFVITGNSPLTGVKWTHISAAGGGLTLVDATTVRATALGNVDPRVTATHLIQLNDNAMGTGPMTKDKADGKRLTSDIAFRAVGFKNARNEGVNGLTASLSLVDSGALVDPVVDSGLVTATQGGEAGWTTLNAWTAALPGGSWTQTADITAPATMDANGHLQTPTRTFTLLAPDPSVSVSVGAGDTSAPTEGWAPGRKLDIVAGLTKDASKVAFSTASVSIIRFNPATGQPEYLASVNPSVWSTGSTFTTFAMGASPGDATIAMKLFSAAETADWTFQDLNLIATVVDSQGTPYSGTMTLDVETTKGADPVHIDAAPDPATPGETVLFTIQESFLNGKARTGNAAGTNIYLYDPSGTLIVNGANPTELQYGTYLYSYATTSATAAGSWYVIAKTTDSLTGDVNAASTTFYVRPDQGSYAPEFIAPSVAPVSTAASNTFKVFFTLYGPGGAMVDPTSNQVDLSVTNQAGAVPTGVTLGGSPAGRMTRDAQGQYSLIVTVGTTATPDTRLALKATYTLLGTSRIAVAQTVIQDYSQKLSAIQTSLATLQTDLTATKNFVDTLETKWGSMDAATLAGYVDSLEGSVGAAGDLSSAATIFGRIKQLNELTTDDEADLTALINTLQTTANTISTNLNAFRTEVGATGQSETAYAKLLALQSAITTLQTDLTAVKNVGSNQFVAPTTMQVPASGTKTYVLQLNVANVAGLKDPDSSIVDIAVVNQAGSAPAGVTLAGSPAGRMTRVAQGQYTLAVTVGTTAVPEDQLRWTATYLEGGVSRKVIGTSTLSDLDTQLNRMETALTTLQTDATTIKGYVDTLETKWGSMDAATLAGYVDTVETVLGTSSDTSAATTVFGRIKQLNELTTDDEADLTALINGVQTTANTVSTNLNAFRTEVGATGQAQTAYALLQTVQTAIGTLQTDVTAIKNVGVNQFVVPATLQVPATSTKTYILALNIGNVGGLKDPDSNIVDIAVVNQAGSAPTGVTLAGSPAGRMTRVAQGQYTLSITVGTSAIAEDQVRWTATYLEGGATRKIIGTSTLMDLDTQLNRVETALTALQTDATAIKADTNALVAKWGSWTAATLAAEVDGLEEAVGNQADSSSTATLFGRIKQLNELTADDEADLTALIGTLQTTANTVSTTLNAFRAEVGAQGQSLTAYQLLQAIEADVADVDTDIAGLRTLVEYLDSYDILPGAVWHFRFNEATGTTYSSSIGPYVATMEGATQVDRVSGPEGLAVFGGRYGDDDRAPISGGSTAFLLGDFSLDAWVNREASATEEYAILMTENMGQVPTQGISFTISNGGILKVYTTSASTTQTVSWSGTAVPTGSWTHVAFAVDRQDTQIVIEAYINGVSLGTQTSTVLYTATSYVALLGDDGTDNEANTVGGLDDARAFSRTISDSEANYLYASSSEVGRTTYLQNLGTNLGTVQTNVARLLGITVRDSGLAQASSSSGLTLATTASTVSSTYVGGVVYITSGTGAGQSRVITGYTGSTRVATLSRSWVTNPPAGSDYVIFSSMDAPLVDSSLTVALRSVDRMFGHSGTAQAGTSTTITLASAASSVDDFYNGQAVKIYSSTGTDQVRVITDYVGATRVATVDRAWVTTPTSSSVYALILVPQLYLDGDLAVKVVKEAVALVQADVDEIQTDTDALLAKWGTATAAEILAEVDALEEAVGTSADTSAEATVFGRIKQLNELTTDDEADLTALVSTLQTTANTISTNLNAFRTEVGAQGQSQTAYALLQTIQTALAAVGGDVDKILATGATQVDAPAWLAVPSSGTRTYVLHFTMQSMDGLDDPDGNVVDIAVTNQAGAAPTGITLAGSPAGRMTRSAAGQYTLTVTVGTTAVPEDELRWIATYLEVGVTKKALAISTVQDYDIQLGRIETATTNLQTSINTVDTVVDSILAKWGSYTASQLAGYVDTLETSVGSSTDGAAVASLFGKIADLKVTANSNDATTQAAIVNLQTTASTVSTNLDALRTEVGAAGQSQTAYALLQTIQSAITDLDSDLAIARTAIQAGQDPTGSLVGSWKFDEVPMVGGTNLIPNAGFETYPTTPGLPPSWSSQGGNANQMTKETTVIRSGANALKITNDASLVGNSPGVHQSLTGLVAGQTYYVEAWARVADASSTAILILYNPTDSQTMFSQSTQVTTHWVKLSGTFTPVAGKTYSINLKENSGQTAGRIAYFDDTSVRAITVQDSGPGGFHGTLRAATTYAGAPTPTAGRSGGGYLFDGVNDYIEVNDAEPLTPKSITVEFWTYLNANPECDANNNWRNIIAKGSNSGTTTGYDILLEQARQITWDVGTGTANRAFTTVTVDMNVWNHFVLTYDANSGVYTVYKNGVSAASGAFAAGGIAPNTSPLRIGGSTQATACPNGNGAFPGILDGVKLYNRALSNTEAKSAYDQLHSDGSATPMMRLPEALLVPSSGSRAYTVDLTLNSLVGLKDPDTNQVDIAVVNQAGVAPTGITLGGSPAGRMTRSSQGVYAMSVTVASTAAINDQLRFTATYLEGGVQVKVVDTAYLNDLDVQLGRIETATTNLQTDVTAIKADTTAILAKWGSWTAATLAAEVDDIEERLGTSTDASSANTLFGKVQSFRELHIADDASLDSQLSTITTTANTISTNLNAFRTEVGAQGQSQTAYALMQSIQSALTTVGADVVALKAVGEPILSAPVAFEIPASGSRTYQVEFTLQALTGLKDADSSIVDLAVTNQAGSAPTGITLAGTPAGRFTRTAAGLYGVQVTVASTATPTEQLRWTASYTEGTVAKKVRATTLLTDADTQLGRIENAVAAVQADVDLLQADTTAILAKWGSWTAATLAAEVDSLEESVGSQADASSTATLFGRIKQLKETADTNDASIDTQLANLQTTANTVSTNVNAFRTEVGAQGQAQTAYALIQSVQTALTAVGTDVTAIKTKGDPSLGVPAEMQIPSTGSRTYQVDFWLGSILGAKDADSNIVDLAVVNQAGSAPTGITLAGTPAGRFTRSAAGIYSVQVTVASTAVANDQLRWTISYLEGTIAKKVRATTVLEDVDTQLNRMEAAQTAIQADVDLLQLDTAAILAKWGTWTAATLAAEVDTIEESIGLSSDATSATTLYGRLNYLMNTAPAQQNDINALQDSVDALAAVTAAFRTEVGAQGQSQTAYALVQSVQTSLAAVATDVTAIRTTGDANLAIPALLQIPATGSATYVVEFGFQSTNGAKDPDSNLVDLAVVNQAGAPPAGITLAGTPAGRFTRTTTGAYTLQVTVASTAVANDQLRWTVSYTEATVAKKVRAASVLTDLDAQLNRMEGALTAVQADVDLLQVDTAAIIAKWGSWTAATLAAEVDGLEESVGAQADSSSTATLFGRIKQLKETADTNDASIDTQLASLTTTANTVSTNLNAFRTEVGAQGQSQTAYALIQSVQTSLTAVANDVTAIKTKGDPNVAIPVLLQIPATGSATYVVEFGFQNTNGAKDPDSNVVDLAVTNQAGAAPTGITLAGTPAGRFTRTTTGAYTLQVTVANTAVANDELRWTVSYTEGGVAKKVRAASVLTDLDAQLNRMEAAQTALQADVDLLQTDTAAILAKWGTWTAASLAAEVDGLEESVGAQGDASSTATLFGRIKQLKETADTNDASIDSQLSTITTTANTISTNLNAFRAEVGAQGQSQTAYALIQSVQTGLAAVATDVTALRTNGDPNVAIPVLMQVPATGSATYVVEFGFQSVNGAKDPDSNIVDIAVLNQAGSAPTGVTLAGTPAGRFTRTVAGAYTLQVTVASTAVANDELRWTVSYAEGGAAKKIRAASVLTDLDAQLNRMEAAQTALQADVDLLQVDTAAILAKWGSWTAASLAAEVDSLEESVGIQSDLSSAATLFGRIKQLKETADTNDASIDTQLANLQTTANTVSTNVNAFRAEVGATGQSETAYAKLQALQAALASLAADVTVVKNEITNPVYGLAAAFGITVRNAGTAQAGATSTITLATSASSITDTYDGAVVYLTGGTGAGQTRVVNAYTGSTRVATVSRNWVTNPDTTTTYVVYATQDALATDSSQAVSLRASDRVYGHSGTAQGATSTTITLTSGASSINDFYTGMPVKIYSGTGSDQTRIITAYVGSTKVATVDRAWAATPTSSSSYVILNNGELFIDGSIGLVNIEADVDTLQAQLTTLQTDVTAIKADTTAILAKWGSWNAATLAAEVDGIEESIGSAADASWQNTLFGKIKDLNELAVANDASIDTQLASIQTTANAVNTLLADLHAEVGAHGKTRTAYKLLEDLEVALADLNGDVASAQAALLADSAARWGQWRTLFETYWADYNATEQANLLAILDRIEDLESANQARFTATLADLEAKWLALTAEVNQNENRLIAFEARLNATLAAHMAALLAFEESIQDTIAEERSLLEGLWGDLNATQAAAGTDRQAKFDAIMASILAESGALQDSLDVHHTQTMENLTDLQDFTTQAFEDHDAYMVAQFTSTQDSLRENFTALGALFGEHEETRSVLAGFWTDHNQTWAAWNTYYAGSQGNASADLQALVIAEANTTRNLDSFNHETYFNKYGSVVQEYSGYVVGGLGEEILKVQDKLEENEEQNFWQLGWISLVVDFVKWGFLALIVIALGLFGVSSRIRGVVRNTTPVASIIEGRRRRAEAKAARAAERVAREKPRNQGREDRPRGVAAQEGPGPARMAPRNWRP